MIAIRFYRKTGKFENEYRFPGPLSQPKYGAVSNLSKKCLFTANDSEHLMFIDAQGNYVTDSQGRYIVYQSSQEIVGIPDAAMRWMVYR